jgi:hypothetical protein
MQRLRSRACPANSHAVLDPFILSEPDCNEERQEDIKKDNPQKSLMITSPIIELACAHRQYAVHHRISGQLYIWAQDAQS